MYILLKLKDIRIIMIEIMVVLIIAGMNTGMYLWLAKKDRDYFITYLGNKYDI